MGARGVRARGHGQALRAAAAWVGCVLAGGCAIWGKRAAPTDPLAPPEARQVSFHGWRSCWRLDNGLVRATVVPQVGGRTLEFALGAYNFLFIGRGELGTTHAEAPDKGYRHFGGQFAQLHPEERWVRLQSTYPPALFMGNYDSRLLPPQDGRAAVELTGPPDLATGTRLVRRVELDAGSTHLRITDTVTNIRHVAQDWGIQAMLQLKGVPEPSGVLRGHERPTGAIALYAPLNPKSRFRGGVSFAGAGEAHPGAEGSWSTRDLPGILSLRYRRQLGKALLDPALPWVAFVDHSTGYVLVQKCAAPEKVLLSAGGLMGRYPFVEVQCLGKIESLAPGQSTTLVQDWFAACCGGAVVDVRSAGVVASPLSLLRGEGKTWVAGRFGVFYLGRAAVVFRGADGRELGRLDCGPVTPLERFAINRAVEVPAGAAEVLLEVADAAGRPVGDLGRIALKPQ